MLCVYSDITKLDEQVLVSLNGVFDRGQRVDRVLQLLFMGSFAFVAIFKRCRISLIAIDFIIVKHNYLL